MVATRVLPDLIPWNLRIPRKCKPLYNCNHSNRTQNESISSIDVGIIHVCSKLLAKAIFLPMRSGPHFTFPSQSHLSESWGKIGTFHDKSFLMVLLEWKFSRKCSSSSSSDLDMAARDVWLHVMQDKGEDTKIWCSIIFQSFKQWLDLKCGSKSF